MTAVSPFKDMHPFRLRIEDFELLQRAGVFDGDRKVELIEGVLVAVNAEFMRHTRVKNEIMFRLRLALERVESRFTAVVEPTLALPPYNLPEPDVMVTEIASDRDYFRLRHIAIVIEIADTTLADDLGVKRAMYAEQGVPEYWVVDVRKQDVHQFWNPVADGFAASRTVLLAGPISSATVPDVTIDGQGIL